MRGCIVSSDLSVLNLVIVKKGEQELPGLTDEEKPRVRGPKRASKIRKMFNLSKVRRVHAMMRACNPLKAVYSAWLPVARAVAGWLTSKLERQRRWGCPPSPTTAQAQRMQDSPTPLTTCGQGSSPALQRWLVLLGLALWPHRRGVVVPLGRKPGARPFGATHTRGILHACGYASAPRAASC